MKTIKEERSHNINKKLFHDRIKDLKEEYKSFSAKIEKNGDNYIVSGPGFDGYIVYSDSKIKAILNLKSLIAKMMKSRIHNSLKQQMDNLVRTD